MKSEVRLPCPERHHYFLERGVAGALPDAVDGAFRLSRARTNARQRVGDGQPEIVVTMRGDRRALHAMNIGANSSDKIALLLWCGVADGVGHVERRRACVDRYSQNLLQESGFGRRRVFAAELHLCAER